MDTFILDTFIHLRTTFHSCELKILWIPLSLEMFNFWIPLSLKNSESGYLYPLLDDLSPLQNPKAGYLYPLPVLPEVNVRRMAFPLILYILLPST